MRIGTFGFALLVVTAMATASIQPTRAEDTCWSVYHFDQPPNDDLIADDVICMSSETTGIVRESPTYGADIQGCNSVTAEKLGSGGGTLTVDYSKCPAKDAPSHKLACPQLKALNKCTWTFTTGKFAGTSDDAFLPREK